VLLFKKVEIST